MLPIFSLPTEFVIGFDPKNYHVRENAGTVTLRVKVLNGLLGEEVSIDFTTQSGTALGKSLT